EAGLRTSDHLFLPKREQHEAYVGSSIQFQVTSLDGDEMPRFISRCATRGVELKWFGASEPVAFTSRYDSWQYFGEVQDLPKTREVLSRTCDMRVPLTFDLEDCTLISRIICEEIAELAA
ncbi:MAG: aminotransferase, partial [Pseudomonadota bacterium]